MGASLKDDQDTDDLVGQPKPWIKLPSPRGSVIGKDRWEGMKLCRCNLSWHVYFVVYEKFPSLFFGTKDELIDWSIRRIVVHRKCPCSSRSVVDAFIDRAYIPPAKEG